MKTRPTLVLFALIAGLVPTIPSAQSELVFSEDFETYAPGSDLNGQGGWSGGNGVGSPSSVRIADGSALSSRVLDGYHPLLAGAIHFLGHTMPVTASGKITTLAFKAYAFGDGTPSLNSGLAIGYEPVPDPFAGTLGDALRVVWSIGAEGWTFDASGIGGGVEPPVPSSYDMEVELRIVLDRAAGQIFGVYKDALRTVESAHHPVTAEVFGQLDAMTILQDQSPGRLGVEIDDITVDTVSSVGPSLVEGVAIHYVSSEYNAAPWDLRAIHCSDGSGLSGAPPVHAQLDASHPNSWQTITTSGGADIQFDLGAVVRLSHLHLWNLNFYPPYNGRGARQVRISTSLDASAWTVAVPQVEFPMATGANGDPGFALCATAWPEGRYVRFEVLSNWGGSDNAGHTGLSEVRFFSLNPFSVPFAITHFERQPLTNEIILGFPASVELRYTIEWSEDLESWQEAMTVEAPGNLPEWRVTLPGQALETARHFRVRACVVPTN